MDSTSTATASTLRGPLKTKSCIAFLIAPYTYRGSYPLLGIGEFSMSPTTYIASQFSKQLSDFLTIEKIPDFFSCPILFSSLYFCFTISFGLFKFLT